MTTRKRDTVSRAVEVTFGDMLAIEHLRTTMEKVDALNVRLEERAADLLAPLPFRDGRVLSRALEALVSDAEGIAEDDVIDAQKARVLRIVARMVTAAPTDAAPAGTATAEKICATCQWFAHDAHAALESGKCSRMPPSALDTMRSAWPTVMADDVCGEHTP